MWSGIYITYVIYERWNLLAKQSGRAAQVKIETEWWSRLKRNKFASNCMFPWMH